MKRSDFETMCKWTAARLRCKGVNVSHRDASLARVIRDHGLVTVEDVVDLSDSGLTALARELRTGNPQAA